MGVQEDVRCLVCKGQMKPLGDLERVYGCPQCGEVRDFTGQDLAESIANLKCAIRQELKRAFNVGRKLATEWLGTTYIRRPENSIAAQVERDKWRLTVDQMFFMMDHHNAILDAYQRDDMEALREIEASDEYRKRFGQMSFDEAFDRYESAFVGDE